MYPELARHVRVQQFAGRASLMMPHFDTPERNDETLALVKACLEKNFAARGLMHRDVAWRNVGVYSDENAKPVAVVYDLDSVCETTDKSWVEAAIASLKEKM